MTETDFKAWVDRLVQTCLPLDVQKKLLSTKPLTKAEADQYVAVVQLVIETMTLKREDAANEMLANVNRKLRTLNNKATEISSKVDLAIWEASAHNPVYKTSDSRTIKAVKRMMVDEAVTRLLTDKKLSERSICENILKRFTNFPGAYDDLDAFRKQVNRSLKRNL